jgi:hypothetical protein
MRLLSVPLARAFAYLPLEEMTLGTGIYLPRLAASLVERCQFLKSPRTPEEFNLADGVNFESGTFNGLVIRKLTVFPLVMHLDAADSTDKAQDTLLRILQWAKEEFDLRYSSEMITRWAFVSDITFQTEFPLLERLSPILNLISKRISGVILENLKENLEYRPAKFWLAHDPDKRSAKIAPFSIEHLALSQDEENKFYSEAPIPTRHHLALLEELENALKDKNEG